MANIKISDLPPIALPAVGADTFFEVQTVAAGEDVSRKISLDDIVSTTGLDASFLTVTANAQLPNERVLTEGTNISFVDTGPNGTLTINTTSLSFPLLAPDGSAGIPQYSFASDPDTGVYLASAGELAFTTGGTQRFTIFGNDFFGSAAGGPNIRNRTASATDPTFVPNANDADTGLGSFGLGALSLVADGVEGVRVTEVAAAITVDILGALNVSGLATFNGLAQFNDVATFSGDVQIRDGSDFEIFDGTNTFRALLTTLLAPDRFRISGAGDLEFFDVQGFNTSMRLHDGVSLAIEELGAAPADAAGFGQFWVRNDVPNVPMFTDDTGTDFELNAGGNVFNVGLPLDNQIAVWTGEFTIEGDPRFIWTGSRLEIFGAGLSNRMRMEHDDTDFNMTAINGGAFNINGLGDGIDIESNASSPAGNLFFKVHGDGNFAADFVTARFVNDDAADAGGTRVELFGQRETTPGAVQILHTGASHLGTPIVDGPTGTLGGIGTVGGAIPFSLFTDTIERVRIESLGITLHQPIYIIEQAAANADTAGQGQFWVRNDGPNVAMFTNDVGTDFVLGGAVGTPDLQAVTTVGNITNTGIVITNLINDAQISIDVTNVGGPVNIVADTDMEVIAGATMLFKVDAAGSMSFNIGTDNAMVIQDEIVRVNTNSGGFFEIRDDIGSNLRINMTSFGPSFIAAAIVGGDPVSYFFQPVSGGEGMSFKIAEMTAAPADSAGFGQLWVRDDTPNNLIFTDDAGTDFVLNAAAGGVTSFEGRVGAVVAIEADYDAFYLVKAAFAAQSVAGDVTFDGKVTFTDVTGVQFDPSVEIDMRNPADNTTFFMQYVAAGVAWGLAGTDFNSVFMDFGASFTHFRFGDPILMTERAAAVADVAALGQFWVRNDVPNTPMFTDDVGTDFELNTAAAVPGGANTAVQFNNAGAFGGSPDFEWDGSELKVEASQAGIIADESDGGGASFVRVTSSSTADSGIQLEFNSTTGTDAALRQVTPAGGLEDIWISFAEDAGVGIRHNNIQKLLTVASGVQFDDSLYVVEKAAANADVTAQGQFWVRSDVPNTPMFTDDTGVDHVLNAAGAVDNDAVQARRTTDYLLTTAFVDITMDTTDVETDSAVLNHDLVTNTDNIIIGVTGTYEITVDVTADPDPGAPNRRMSMSARVRLNDLGTGIVGSVVHTMYTRDATAPFDNHLSFSFVATLTATDFITLQLSKTLVGGALGTDNANELSVKVKRLL